jgi:predicted metal-binding membrane protein
VKARAARARYFHPEWIVAPVIASAWALIAVRTFSAQPNEAMTLRLPHIADVALGWFGVWVLMTIAMMAGPAMPTIHGLALSTRWHRRSRTVWMFLTVYLYAWLLFGFVGHYGLHAIGALFGLPSRVVLVSLLLIAVLWELSEVKRRALRACSILAPLPVDGRAADRATARRAATFALRSMTCCWPIMLAMSVGPIHVFVMAILTVLTVLQLTAIRAPRASRLSAAVVACAAIGAFFG